MDRFRATMHKSNKQWNKFNRRFSEDLFVFNNFWFQNIEDISDAELDKQFKALKRMRTKFHDMGCMDKYSQCEEMIQNICEEIDRREEEDW